MTFNCIPLPAFKDNYIWLLVKSDQGLAVCIDPGDAQVVIDFVTQNSLQLSAILITHHHWDHTGGIKGLLKQYPTLSVYGPASLASVTHPIKDNTHIAPLALDFQVLATPGHTLDHISYYGHGKLFCGDTLFAAGCGRLFEGTAKQLYNSLQSLAHLPKDTQVYCAHEYTLHNLQFAAEVEPNNPHVHARLAKVHALRQQQEVSLPSLLSDELDTNPFLRCEEPTVHEAATHYAKQKLNSPIDVFAAIRAWKDDF